MFQYIYEVNLSAGLKIIFKKYILSVAYAPNLINLNCNSVTWLFAIQIKLRVISKSNYLFHRLYK